MDEFVERLAGYSAIITATCMKIMQKDNLTKDQMCEKIDKYLLTKGLKEKVKNGN